MSRGARRSVGRKVRHGRRGALGRFNRRTSLERLERRHLLTALIQQSLASLTWSAGPSLLAARGGAVFVGSTLLGGKTATADVPSTAILSQNTSGVWSWTSGASLDPGVSFAGVGHSEPALHVLATGGGGGENGAKYLSATFLFGGATQNVATSAVVNNPADQNNTIAGPSLQTARSDFAYASDALTGEIFAMGGKDSGGHALATAEVYDGSTDSWHYVSSLPQAISGGAGFDDNLGHVYVFGGADSTGAPVSTVYRYTIATDRWDQVSSLPVAAKDIAVAAGQDGRAYLFGGRSASGAISNVEIYSPAEDRMTADAPLPVAVSGAAATVQSDNSIWVAGGFNSAGQAMSTVFHTQPLPLDVPTQLKIVHGFQGDPTLEGTIVVASTDSVGNVVDSTGSSVQMTPVGAVWPGAQSAANIGGLATFYASVYRGYTATLQFNQNGLRGASLNVNAGSAQQFPIIEVTGGSSYYDGQQHAASAVAVDSSGNPVAGSISLQYVQSTAYNPNGYGTTYAPWMPGTYAVVATFTSSDPNYADTTGNARITILPQTPTVIVPGATFADDGATHEAGALALAADGTPVSGALSYTYNGSSTPPSAPGVYHVVAKFTTDDPSGFYGSAVGEGTLVIGDLAAPTVTVTGGVFSYDGSSHSGSASVVSSDGVTPVDGDLTLTYNGQSAMPTAPGVYDVVASFTSADPNYADATGEAALVIEGGAPSIQLTGGAFTYNGQAHSASASATGVDGQPLAGHFSFTYNGAATPPSAPGNYVVQAIFTSDNPAYGDATATTNISITGSHLPPFLAATGGSFVYNGAAQNATATAVGTDGVTPVAGQFTFTYNGSTTPPVNVGFYNVTATFTSDDPSYTGGSVTTTLSITPASATLTAVGGTIPFDFNPHPATVTAVGVDGHTPVAGSFAVTYNGTSTVPVQPGSYNVVATFTSADPNYTGGTATTTITIPDPTIPTGVTVTGASTTSLTVAWNPVLEPNGGTPTYSVVERIFHPGHGGGRGGIVPPHYTYATVASGVTGTSATITGLTPQSTHTYYVTSTANGVTSAPSALVSGQPLFAASFNFFLWGGAVWDGGSPISVEVGQTVQLTFIASGNEAPTYSTTGGPSSLTVNPTTGLISFTPTAADVGDVTAQMTAANSLGSTTHSLAFHVLALPVVNVAPVVATFDGQTHSATAQALPSAGGAPIGGTFSFQYAPVQYPTAFSTAPYAESGAYIVKATFTSSDPNYGGAVGYGQVTINPATPTITVNGGPFAADGTSHAATPTATGVPGLPPGGSFSFTYNGSPAVPSDPGVYTVLATYTSGSNDYLSTVVTGTLVIGDSPSPVTTIVVGSNSALTLDGVTTPVSAATNVTNNFSSPGGVIVSAANQSLGTITGSGSLTIADGGSLQIGSVSQGLLSIGSGATMTLAASNAQGSPLATQASSGAAGSVASSLGSRSSIQALLAKRTQQVATVATISPAIIAAEAPTVVTAPAVATSLSALNNSTAVTPSAAPTAVAASSDAGSAESVTSAPACLPTPADAAIPADAASDRPVFQEPNTSGDRPSSTPERAAFATSSDLDRDVRDAILSTSTRLTSRVDDGLYDLLAAQRAL